MRNQNFNLRMKGCGKFRSSWVHLICQLIASDANSLFVIYLCENVVGHASLVDRRRKLTDGVCPSSFTSSTIRQVTKRELLIERIHWVNEAYQRGARLTVDNCSQISNKWFLKILRISFEMFFLLLK